MDQDCGHCGSRGSVVKIEDVEVKRWRQHVDTYGTILFIRYARVSKCAACEEVTIWGFTSASDQTESIQVHRLYPSQRDHTALPSKVRERLEVADRVRNIDPGLYAVAIRRMLETIFNERGAEGRDLWAKARDLELRDQLPGTIANAVSRLRDLGKYGAHDAEIEVSARDVPMIEDLANAVLEFLYRAPAAIAALEASVTRRGGRITAGK